MTTNDRMKLIEQCLRHHFSPSQLELIDDSAQHINHPGAGHGGHFTLKIASASLNDRSTIEAHRAIYTALGDLMKTDIHALAIQISKPF